MLHVIEEATRSPSSSSSPQRALVRRSRIWQPPEGATIYTPPNTHEQKHHSSSPASSPPPPTSPASPLNSNDEDSSKLLTITSKAKAGSGSGTTKTGGHAKSNSSSPVIISVPLQDLLADTVNFTMVFDTGSSDLWVPSVGCTTPTCLTLARYNSTASKTYHAEGKVLDVKYGDGSHISGLTGLDSVLISGVSVANQSFGMASVDNSTIAKKGIDGVVGLSFGRIAWVKNYVTVMETMLARSMLTQPIVSIWMGRQRMGGSNAGSGGAVIFGGVDTTKYIGNFTWSPIIDKNSWKIRFTAVSIGGKDLGLSGNALIDSGTSLIIVPTKVASIFHENIPGAIEVPSIGWILPCNTSAGDLNFTISGTQFRVPAEELVVLFRIPGYAEYCKSAVDIQDSASNSDWILGASFMKNVYSVFDYRALAVGFAQPSNVYNTLANITILPNLSNPPTGPGAGNGQTNGSLPGNETSGTNGTGSSQVVSRGQVLLYTFLAMFVVLFIRMA
ncbi:hypothetical protein BGZ83_004964 [Gryganskiella cystojenkinii]|nr:hypothetical protein BGZ83_004964 [Gryganskiella cystojenkinii]